MPVQEELIDRLFHRLQEACSGQIQPSGLEDLARLFISMTIKYLRIMESKGQHVRETRRDIEFEQLASDCIAELLQRDDHGRCHHLEAYYLPLLNTGTDQLEIYLATQRLLAHRSQQQLSRVYRQRDPEGARLRRQLATAIKNHPQLTLKRYIDGNYILWQSGVKGAIREPDNYLVSMLLAELLQTHKPLSQILPALFERLAKHYPGPLALPVSSVMQTIRAWRHTTQEPPPPAGIETAVDWPFYAMLIENALSKINQVLLQNYVQKGKLTLAEAAALFEALAAKGHAALAGEEEISDRAFLENCWPQGVAMQNPKKINSVFDYLLRIFRRELHQKMDKFF